MPIGHTERGFAEYADFTDTYGVRVRVRRSSAATVDAVWMFVDRPGAWPAVPAAAHLDVEQARTLVAALQEWIDQQEARNARTRTND